MISTLVSSTVGSLKSPENQVEHPAMPPSRQSNTTVLRILIVCAWHNIPVLQRTATCSKQHACRNGGHRKNTRIRPPYDNDVSDKEPPPYSSQRITHVASTSTRTSRALPRPAHQA